MKPTYFHGVPGAANETLLAGIPQSAFASTATHLIGFSLGAHAALRYASENPWVTQIDLISPAAPLELGDFLPHMAGRPVFNAARANRLSLLTHTQALLLRTAPNLFLKMLFQSAPAADQAILNNPIQRKILHDSYRSSILDNRNAYLNAVTNYVKPWHDLLALIRCDVRIWYGTADTWAPPQMAQALAATLPNATLVAHDTLGHYSTLTAALPKIIARKVN